MKKNKTYSKLTFMLQVDTFDIKKILCSTIDMFSVFCWNNTYKNPYEDKKLNKLIRDLDSYVQENYVERR